MGWINDLGFITLKLADYKKLHEDLTPSLNHLEDEFLKMEHTIEEYDREHACLKEKIEDLRKGVKYDSTGLEL